MVVLHLPAAPVYLGDLGEDSHAGATALHSSERRCGLGAGDGRPVGGSGWPTGAASWAVMRIIASFKEGDLTGGLLSGLRMLSDQAGAPHHSR
jgi:hypothetical protein